MNTHLPPAVKSLARQISAFIGVGAVATSVDYAAFLTLLHFVTVSPVSAALGGYALGGVTSYGLTRRHVFESARSHQSAGWRFGVVMAAGFFLTGVFMDVFSVYLGAPPIFARIMTTLTVMIFNFLAHRFWTFGR